ncbi:MAG: hypothetical protein RIK87_27245 [Fuerstiella sp.]
MHPPPNNLPPAQAQLMACLATQETHYAAATELISRLQQSGGAGQQNELTELQRRLARIRSTGQEVQAATEAFYREGQPKSPLLDAALKNQEVKLLEFLNQIDQLQQDFRTIQERLQPQLDSEVTRRSMHQAYQRSMRTG